MPETQVIELLLQQAAVMNSPEFIAADPVQFPHLYSDLRDIELSALLCATLAWGNRQMICRDCSHMLSLMGHQPYAFLMDKGYEELDPDANIHRTFFCRNLQHFMRGLRPLYQRHGSLQEYARSLDIGASEFPAWELVRALNAQLAGANAGHSDSRCLPLNIENSALKRVNMALRWLVRRDGIVDLGVWDVISPHQLFIPLDVHVGRTARTLGLMKRRSNDRKAALELTQAMRQIDPDDPARLDFALFGISFNHLID